MATDASAISSLQSGGTAVADRCVFSDASDLAQSFTGGVGALSLSTYYDCQFIGSYNLSSASTVKAKFFNCILGANIVIGNNATLIWSGGEISTGNGTITVSGSGVVNISAQIQSAVTITASGSSAQVVDNIGRVGGAVAITATNANVTVRGVWAAVSFSGAHSTQWVFDGVCADLDFTGPGQVNATVGAGTNPHRAVLRGTGVSAILSMQAYTVPALKYIACSHSTVVADVVDIGAGSQAYTFDASSNNNLLILGGSHQAGFTTASTNLGVNNRIITELDDSFITGIINSGVLRGQPGQDGEDGFDGFPGPAGPAGAAGAAGAAGVAGRPVDGIDGEDGMDGFGLPGPQGIRGLQGIQGPPGMPGIDGEDGEPGRDATPQDLTPYAKLASPTFTGTPAAPTQTNGDNSTKLATTAYVDAVAGGAAAWTAYTPALIQSASVAHTTNSARFKLQGKTMHVELDITATAAGTATVKILVGLPSSTDSPGGSVPVQNVSAASPLGFGVAALGGTVYHVTAVYDQLNGITPLVVMWRHDTTGNVGVGAAAPTTALANTDRMLLNLTYEVS